MDPHASYNITNDRLKFYPPAGERLSPEDYERARGCKFQWWPGQKCFSAVWTPGAEDFIIAQGYTIEEDDSPDDVEARVNRFAGYAAGAEAEAAAAAERAMNATTERRERLASNTARNQAEEAEYWTRRISGAIAHAAYKDRPDVIARRIKGLEADKRRNEKHLKEARAFLALWQVTPITRERAVKLANFGGWMGLSGKFPGSHYQGEQSLWGVLDKNEISPEDAQAFAVRAFEEAAAYDARWIAHLDMRLEYERAYCVAVGGAELLEPKKREVHRRPAPEDGLKKGDSVWVQWPPYYREAVKCTIMSLGTANVRVTVPPEKDVYGNWKEGYQVLRRYVKKAE